MKREEMHRDHACRFHPPNILSRAMGNGRIIAVHHNARLMTIRVLLITTLTVVIGWAGVAVAVAQSAGGGATVASLHASGSQRFREGQILRAAGLRPGSRIDKNDMEAAAQRLISSGAFAHVAFHYAPFGGGIAVTFEVIDAEQFLACRFANFVWVPESQLLDGLKAKVPLFEGEVSTSGEMGDRVDRALEAILREHGVIATVDHGYFQSSTRSPISAEVFTAHGPSLPIREVVFTGNHEVDSAALNKAAQPLIGHEHDEVFEEDFFKGDPSDLYFERGYLRVSFGRSHPALIGGGVSGPVRITVPVTEGLQYNFGEIAWSGNTAFSGERLTGQIHLETGKPANGVELDHDLAGVSELYGTRGYLMARAEATPSFDDATRTVNYSVAVTEGDQFRMGHLVVIGIDGAHADMLKSDSKQRPGDPFDQSYWKYFLATHSKDLPAGSSSSKKLVKTDVRQDTKTVDVTVSFDPPVFGPVPADLTDLPGH
jgi:outer membrane protein assembly factor BamA